MVYVQVEVKEAVFMHELVLVLMGVLSAPDADAQELADSETDNSFRVGGMAHVGVFDFKSVIFFYFYPQTKLRAIIVDVEPGMRLPCWKRLLRVMA